MASHQSTPRSVLDAPAATATWFVHHFSPNRAARRHWRTADGALRFIPKARQAPAYNEAYRRPAA